MADATAHYAERPLWAGRPSPVAYLSTFILCALFCWLVVPIFVAIWTWLEVTSVSYEVTTERFRRSSGFLSRRTEDLELYRIKQTTFDQPFILRIFGLANVMIVSSDVKTHRWIIGAIPVRDAKFLWEELRGQVERLRTLKQVREQDVR